MQNQSRRNFWLAALVVLAIKLLLAAAIPITSDEAYFVFWAKNPDFGYYDHPPMIGWILHAFLFPGNSTFILRLPAVFSTILIGMGIFFLLDRTDKEKASLTAILFLISPMSLLFVLVTTDTPVILFSFFSVLFLKKGLEKEEYRYYILSGVLFGLALLSKYFAVFIGLAYLTYLLFSSKKSKFGFLLLFLSAIPFVLINIFWNYTHCWTNLLFNLFNRNRQEEFSMMKVLIFIVSQIYLMTPPFIYYLFSKRRILIDEIFSRGRNNLFLYLFSVPLFMFLMISLKKVVGLHWVLAFYPFFYLFIFQVLDKEALQKSLKFMFIFSLVHLFLIGAILSTPLKFFKNNKNYPIMTMSLKPGGIKERLLSYEDDFVFATPSYAESAVMSYQYGRYFIVFGGGSYHGRQDDILTDFRAFSGKNILVLTDRESPIEEYLPYFRKVEVKKVIIEDAVFYLILGHDFKFDQYRERILKPIKESYYTIPSYLPLKACYFIDRYFKE
ncbi:MAG: glycosyltransferase family 39 protein [Nitrospirae bacterium]|nr:glycosyltransferase family 39 protein [Nitrospirota bacterium]